MSEQSDEAPEPEPPAPFPPPLALDPRDLPRSALAEYDRLGRKQPHVLGLAHHLLYIPGMAARMRMVPPSAVVQEAVDGEALVNCPCGGHPIARREIEKCPGCDRWYFLLVRVYVVYGDMEPPQVARTSQS